MESTFGLSLSSASATQWPTYLLLTIITSLWLIKRHVCKVDVAPSEPALLLSGVPFLGHLLGMFVSGSGYYMSLFRKNGRQLRAATLSLFGHKVYVIFSPSLAQAALRNRDLSFEPFVVLASQALANLEGRSLKLLRDGTISRAFFHTLPSVVSAEPMSRMAATGLLSMTGEVSQLCHQIDSSVNKHVEVPDLFGYLKRTMTLAVTDALYGLKDNVFRDDLTLIDDLWYDTFPLLATLEAFFFTAMLNIDIGNLMKLYLTWLLVSCRGCLHPRETVPGSESKLLWPNTTANTR